MPNPDIDPKLARRIIDNLGGSGQPPEFGVQHFTVGLDPYLDVIKEEYLSTFIKDGGSVFKLVVGIYGGGKTHFLYTVRDLAWEQNYAVSYVSLKSSGESPFHKLELVYKAIANGILPPLSPTELNLEEMKGFSSFLKSWYGDRRSRYQEQGMSLDAAKEIIRGDIKQIDNISSISFKNAVVHALKALVNEQETAFDKICQWLQGENFDRRQHSVYGITQKIDRTTAFTMIRSLGQVIRQMGYSGLVVLLDEAERVPSLSTKQREQHLSNLREVIDECSQSAFQGMMIFYAVPGDNFLDGQTQVYEALNQRLSTRFQDFNPTGVRIELEKLVEEAIDFLHQVGERIALVYDAAYKTDLPQEQVEKIIDEIARWAYEERFADDGYKRLFVQKLIPGLNFLRVRKTVPEMKDLEKI